MQEQIETSINKSEVGNEIDLLQIFRNIWIGRKIIYKTVVIFFVLGIIIVIGTPKDRSNPSG